MTAAELPTVTVIIVNLNGREFLPACLESLACQDYPRSKTQILVVDNGSTDKSLPWLCANFPQVELLALDHNYGFAAANNRAARAASGELLAFLNNDTRAAENWLSALVHQKQSAPDVAAVASCILSWDGREIDFVRGVLSYIGHAYQRDEGGPAAQRPQGPAYELLFACGGAMLIDRDLFLATGGFDEKFFAYFEDVDLGWRLWLMGYRVICAPDAIVYHRGHGTGGRLPFFQKLVLFERNALRMVYKNSEEQNFWRVFSGTLLQAFARQAGWLKARGWDENAYALGASVDETLPACAGREGLAITVAANQLIRDLPDLQAQRAQIQGRRRRPDADIYPLFGQPMRPYIISHPAQDEALAAAHYTISAAMGITALFEAVPRRVLLLWADARGDPSGAQQERSRQLAEGLASCGHEVLIMAGPDCRVPESLACQILPVAEGAIYLLPRINPDVVVACGPAALSGLPDCHLPLVLDVAGQLPTAERAAHAAAWARVDFFTCASSEQRVYYAEWLQSAGFDDLDRQEAVCGFSDPAQAEGWAALDRFCRSPYKRGANRHAEIPDRTEPKPAPPPVAAPLPAREKNLLALLHEARLHYRQGGFKRLLIETLGFAQRYLIAHM